MHLVLVAMPWHVLPHANAAAGLLSTAVADQATSEVYYGSLEFAERMLADATVPGGRDDLSPELYRQIGEKGYISGVAEWIFAGAIRGNPEEDQPEALAVSASLGLDPDAVSRLRVLAREFADHAAEQVLSRRPDVVGLTTTFAQTSACLAVAQRLKERAPDLPIVFGGSNCDGEMGAALFEAFDCIDFVVRREGEVPLRRLLAALEVAPGAERDRDLAQITGLCWRPSSVEEKAIRVNAESGALPAGGDFPRIVQDDYVAAFETSPMAEHMPANLVFETSRGCWWGTKSHCTFCGLDDLIMPFRAKPADQADTELRELVDRHQVLDIVTTDNILERSYFEDLLPLWAKQRPDWRLFYEIKANLTDAMAASLRAAGIVQVQPGIENLHSGPLKLMSKGTTGVANVAALRDLQAHGITVSWNYLYGFPTERDVDYLEVVDQMPRLRHLQPPVNHGRIELERFNPYFLDPSLGFAEREPMSWYPWVYPHVEPEVRSRIAYLFDTAQVGVSDPVLAQLVDAMDQWTSDYSRSELTHRVVGEQTWVYDRRAGTEPVDLCLGGARETAAYAALRRGQSADRLARTLRDGGDTTATGAWCEDFLADLDQHQLVFVESGRAVALSLPHDPARLLATSRPVGVTAKANA